MELKAELKRIAEKVTRFIIDNLDKEPRLLYDAGLHLIKSGGKRLRPFILIKFYNLYRQDEDPVLPAAAALELVHNFSLIHDDIMDRDDFRHNVPTVHRTFGDSMAILAGDALFAKAFELLTITPILTDERLRKAVMVLSKASIELCKGQTEDVTSFKREFDESYYYSLINKKTSSLLAASSSIGCIAGGGNDEDLRVAEAYGRKLGLAFQLVDDLLGIVGDPNVTGKPVGGDLREGKKTIPIYFALKRASPSEKEVIMRIYGRKEASQEEVERAVNIIKGLGVEDDVRKMADRYAKDALAQLDLLPKGPGRKWLIELVDFVVKRAH